MNINPSINGHNLDNMLEIPNNINEDIMSIETMS